MRPGWIDNWLKLAIWWFVLPSRQWNFLGEYSLQKNMHNLCPIYFTKCHCPNSSLNNDIGGCGSSPGAFFIFDSWPYHAQQLALPNQHLPDLCRTELPWFLNRICNLLLRLKIANSMQNNVQVENACLIHQCVFSIAIPAQQTEVSSKIFSVLLSFQNTRVWATLGMRNPNAIGAAYNGHRLSNDFIAMAYTIVCDRCIDQTKLHPCGKRP